MSAPAIFAPRTQWLRIARPDGAVQFAAVYRPHTPGRHPVVVYLQGSTAITASSISDPRVKVVVADSGYGKAGVDPVHTPILLLAWTDDGHVAHTNVVAFETVLRAADKDVTAQYYPGTGHVPTLAPPPVGTDATDAATRFLQRTLR